MRAIQRSHQKLCPFSTIIPVWRDKTSSSTSRDSIGGARKRASRKYCKYWSAIQRSNQKLWHFHLLFWSGAATPPLQLERASRKYCKYWSAIQRSNQKLWHFSSVILVWRCNTSSSTSRDSIGSPRNRAFGYYCKNLSAIQRCDEKLWRFSAIIPVSRDKTSSSTCRDSTGSPRKRASGNYCNYLSAIQRSDQKL